MGAYLETKSLQIWSSQDEAIPDGSGPQSQGGGPGKQREVGTQTRREGSESRAGSGRNRSDVSTGQGEPGIAGNPQQAEETRQDSSPELPGAGWRTGPRQGDCGAARLDRGPGTTASEQHLRSFCSVRVGDVLHLTTLLSPKEVCHRACELGHLGICHKEGEVWMR